MKKVLRFLHFVLLLLQAARMSTDDAVYQDMEQNNMPMKDLPDLDKGQL